MGRPRLHSDAERKELKKARGALWRAANKEKIAGYYANNRQEYIAKAAAWRAANPEQYAASTAARNDLRKDQIRARRKMYRQENSEKIRAVIGDWCARNKEKRLLYAKEYRRLNIVKINKADIARNTIRRRLIGGQSIAKIYAQETKEIYKNCPPGFHVDHIIPLKGKIVCGLHIPLNLQYLPAKENQSKGAKFDADDYCKQYELLAEAKVRLGMTTTGDLKCKT